MNEENAVGFSDLVLLEFLKPRLADFKLPRRVLVLPSLPRNATGKIPKTVLRERLADSPHHRHP